MQIPRIKIYITALAVVFAFIPHAVKATELCPTSGNMRQYMGSLQRTYTGFDERPGFTYIANTTANNNCSNHHFQISISAGLNNPNCNTIQGNPSYTEQCWNGTWPVDESDEELSLNCDSTELASSTHFTIGACSSESESEGVTSSTYFGSLADSFSIGYSSPTQSLTGTSTFEDFSNTWLGSATGTIPGCYIHSMFGIFDFFKAITNGDLTSQSIHFSMGSSTVETNLAAITFPPEMEHIKLIFWNIFAVVGFLGICWIAFRDFTGADDGDDDEEE